MALRSLPVLIVVLLVAELTLPMERAAAAPGDAVLSSSQIPLDAVGADLELSADGSTAYVSLSAARQIVVVDTSTNRIADSIDVPGQPVGIDLDPTEERLYVALTGQQAVAEVDLTTRAVEVFDLDGLGDPRTYDIVATDRGVFVSANTGSNGLSYIVRLDPGTGANEVVASSSVIRAAPTFSWNGGNSLWVGEEFSPESLYRLDLGAPDAPIAAEDDHGNVFGTRHIALLPGDNGAVLESGQIVNEQVRVTSRLRANGRPVLSPDGAIASLLGRSGTTIEQFDIDSNRELGTLSFPACPATGINGFATTANRSFLILSGRKLCAVTDALGPSREVRCDVDRDGFGDVAMTSAGRDVGSERNAGSVVVVRGSRNGLRDRTAVEFDASTLRRVGRPTDGDALGFSSTCADFDGDGFDDLAVSMPGRDIERRDNAGAVVILPGGPSGPRPERAQLLSQATPGIAGRPRSGDEFGVGLASGDINGDGYADLLVGTPGETVRRAPNAGTLTVIPGSSRGLQPRQSERITQASRGLDDGPERDDRFGIDTVVGDLDQDGFDDAIIGMPFEGVGNIPNAGRLHVAWGSASGLDTTDAVTIDQESSLPGESDEGDGFGESVAIGDHDGDGRVELYVGVPGDDRDRGRNNGAVVMIPAGPDGLSVQRSLRVARGGCQDCFAGISIDIARLAPTESETLLVGVAGHLAGGAGGTVRAGGSIMIGTRNPRIVTMPTQSVQPGALFGFDVMGEDTDGDGGAEILATSPGYDLPGAPNAGLLAEIVLGRAITNPTWTFWHRDVRHVPGDAQQDESFPSLGGV